MALRFAAEGESARLRRRSRNLLGLTRAYRKLFFDDTGALKPESRAVLDDLVEISGIGMGQRDLDPQALALGEGMRRVVLHIFGRFRLPQRQLDQIERDLTLAEEERE